MRTKSFLINRYSSTEAKIYTVHGKGNIWYENGQLSWLYSFKYGLRDGVSVGWFSHGGIYSIENNKGGRRHGLRMIFGASKKNEVKSIAWYEEGSRKMTIRENHENEKL